MAGNEEEGGGMGPMAWLRTRESSMSEEEVVDRVVEEKKVVVGLATLPGTRDGSHWVERWQTRPRELMWLGRGYRA